MEFLIDSRRLGANGSGLLDTVLGVVVDIDVVCAQIVAMEKIARRQRDWMSCMFVE